MIETKLFKRSYKFCCWAYIHYGKLSTITLARVSFNIISFLKDPSNYQQNTKPFFRDRRYWAGRAKTTVILWVSQLALVIITLLFLWCQLCQKLWPWEIKTLSTRRVFIGSSCKIKYALQKRKVQVQDW